MDNSTPTPRLYTGPVKSGKTSLAIREALLACGNDPSRILFFRITLLCNPEISTPLRLTHTDTSNDVELVCYDIHESEFSKLISIVIAPENSQVQAIIIDHAHFLTDLTRTVSRLWFLQKRVYLAGLKGDMWLAPFKPISDVEPLCFTIHCTARCYTCGADNATASSRAPRDEATLSSPPFYEPFCYRCWRALQQQDAMAHRVDMSPPAGTPEAYNHVARPVELPPGSNMDE